MCGRAGLQAIRGCAIRDISQFPCRRGVPALRQLQGEGQNEKVKAGNRSGETIDASGGRRSQTLKNAADGPQAARRSGQSAGIGM
jgi:hypothetical protein